MNCGIFTQGNSNENEECATVHKNINESYKQNIWGNKADPTVQTGWFHLHNVQNHTKLSSAIRTQGYLPCQDWRQYLEGNVRRFSGVVAMFCLLT